MQQHYSRKQRRDLARMMGLLSSKDRYSVWLDRVRRSIGAGKQIDAEFKMGIENSIRTQLTAVEAKALKNLTDSVGEDRAKEIIANNHKIQKDREDRLRARKSRQRKGL